MILVSIWSAKGEGRVRHQKVRDDGAIKGILASYITRGQC